MRHAIQLPDGMLPLFVSPDPCLVVGEEGDYILQLGVLQSVDVLPPTPRKVIAPLFEVSGTDENILAHLLKLITSMEALMPEGHTYIVIRTDVPSHTLPQPPDDVQIGFCVLSLMRRPTPITEVLSEARITPLVQGLLQ